MLRRDTHMVIAHIGPGRAYMLRGGELTQLTRSPFAPSKCDAPSSQLLLWKTSP